jgi:hypothetical protein
MPSGFQQDQNQLSPDFYRVVLTLNGGVGVYTAAAPADGAVNPYDWSSFTTVPTTLANSQRLARGNLRWQAIIEELAKYSDAQILDVEVSSPNSANADSLPTAIAFTVRFDRDDFILGAVQQLAPTFTATSGVVTIDTTAKALRYLVGQAIVRGGTTGYARTYRVYDATDKTESQLQVTITQPDVPGKVYDDVAVILLDGTELISII